MQKITRTLLIGGVIAALYFLGAAMGSRHISARAAGGPSITIDGPIPLPVSGSVTVGNTPLPVSGSVSAQQSGAWNVGLTGTPGVNIANSPTVTLGGSTATLLVRNADDQGRIPYQSVSNMTGQCSGLNTCVFTFAGAPGGHRLVLEHLSGKTWTNTIAEDAQVTLTAGGVDIEGFSIPVPPSRAFVVFDQPVLLYFDGGQGFSVTVTVGGAANFNSVFNLAVAASGYLLDCSVAACAPIAH